MHTQLCLRDDQVKEKDDHVAHAAWYQRLRTPESQFTIRYVLHPCQVALATPPRSPKASVFSLTPHHLSDCYRLRRELSDGFRIH